MEIASLQELQKVMDRALDYCLELTGHPPVRTFLGAPLLFGSDVLGMLGVANRRDGYDRQQQRLLSVFANQVAVAIRNARPYEEQRNMTARLQRLRGQVKAAKRDRLLDDEPACSRS